jgi:hypothetical protein
MTRITLLSMLLTGLLIAVGCGDDDDDNNDNDGTGDPLENDTETETESEEPPLPEKCSEWGDEVSFYIDNLVVKDDADEAAIDQNFDEWEDNEQFFIAKPEGGSGFEDSNTMQSVGGEDALFMHETVDENSNYGYATEIQFQLNDMTDLSGENYSISFDIYVPQSTFDTGVPYVQFAFFNTADDYTPIYSYMYELTPDEWLNVASEINAVDITEGTDDSTISYSGFADDENPSAWQFDVVRIQLVLYSPEDDEDCPDIFN